MRIEIRDADWYAGLTLLERHAVLPARPLAVDGAASSNVGQADVDALAGASLERLRGRFENTPLVDRHR